MRGGGTCSELSRCHLSRPPISGPASASKQAQPGPCTPRQSQHRPGAARQFNHSGGPLPDGDSEGRPTCRTRACTTCVVAGEQRERGIESLAAPRGYVGPSWRCISFLSCPGVGTVMYYSANHPRGPPCVSELPEERRLSQVRETASQQKRYGVPQKRHCVLRAQAQRISSVRPPNRTEARRACSHPPLMPVR